MTKYVIINKYSEKLHRELATLYDDTSLPINEETLKYVEAPQTLVDLITLQVPNKILDIENTKYSPANTWTIVSKDVPLANIQQNRLDELNKLKLEANRFLNIADLPAKLKQDVQQYIAQLNNFVLPTDTAPASPEATALISWPIKPWE